MNTIIIQIKSIQRPELENHDLVLGDLINGTVILKPLSSKETFMVVNFEADPKGSLPKFIVNFFQKSWPEKMINGVPSFGKIVLFKTDRGLFDHFI